MFVISAHHVTLLIVCAGVPIIQVLATDADTRAPFNSITFHITNSSAPGFFVISSDGFLSLLQSVSNRLV